MRAIIVLGMLAIAGCSGPNVTQSAAQCSADTKPFVEYWPCQRPQIQRFRGGGDDVVAEYRATGDLVAENVKSGKISDAEAKLLMARAYREAVQSAAQYSIRIAPAKS